MILPYYVQKRIEIVKSLENVEFPSPDSLINFVCEISDKEREEIFTKEKGGRTEEIFSIRQAIQYLLRKKFKLEYSLIGRLTHKHHATAKYAMEGLEEMLNTYGKHIQPIDLRERLASYFKENPEEGPRQSPFHLQIQLEIKLSLTKAQTYYLVFNHKDRKTSEVRESRTISINL